MLRLFSCRVVVLLALEVILAGGQAPAPPPLPDRFDVISIKPAPSSRQGGGYDYPPGRFVSENRTARELVMLAFGTDSFRTAGGADWIGRERFDITATVAGPWQDGRPAVLVRHLLEDRFGLKAHRETRPLPVYTLTRARTDGTLGPNLRPVKTDCAAWRQNPEMPRCSTQTAPGQIIATGSEWSRTMQFTTLARATGRLVLDRTGLTGQYDITLQWDDPVANDQSRASIFTAVREQLGLRLDARTEPLEVVVIDRIERPAPD